jgi:hypothetical protein
LAENGPLRIQRSKIDHLKTLQNGNNEFKVWEDETERAVANRFGEGSTELKQFRDIFHGSFVINVSRSEAEWQEDYEDKLDKAALTLDSFNRASKPETSHEAVPTYSRALGGLAVTFLFVVLGLPFIFAAGFIIMGFNSIGYYGPPIGQVMQFYYNSAILLATVSAPVAAVVAALLGIERFRKFVMAPFQRTKDEEESRSKV